ncbi:2412_t:CDS:2 [Diversispora eburnea]|uniref:2412_t:CDS:1 n=1 Tax=Diversispora eburnea TaxID=1213867 RepID=A0A9N9BGD0_9GLOM|nr:2412_t:CDS:2 [Diversispora eburnea]
MSTYSFHRRKSRAYKAKTAVELFNNLNSWYLNLSQINRTEYYFEFKLADKLRLKGLSKCSNQPFVKNHPEACYISRLLKFSNLPEPINDLFGDVNLSLENFTRGDDSNEKISDVEVYLDDLIKWVKSSKKNKEIFRQIDNSIS